MVSPCTVFTVHLEPSLTQLELRHRLMRIRDVRATYPEGLGVTIRDFNMCEPEKGRFYLVTQIFSEGDPGRTATLWTLFPLVFGLSQPELLHKKKVFVDGIILCLSRIDRSITSLWRKQEILDFAQKRQVLLEVPPYQAIIYFCGLYWGSSPFGHVRRHLSKDRSPKHTVFTSALDCSTSKLAPKHDPFSDIGGFQGLRHKSATSQTHPPRNPPTSEDVEHRATKPWRMGTKFESDTTCRAWR